MRAGRDPTVTNLADRLPENRRAALRLVPVSRETEERLAASSTSSRAGGRRPISSRNPRSLRSGPATSPIQRPAPRPRAGGLAMGRHGFGGRVSRPRDRHSARRRARRRRSLHRERSAQMRFLTRSGSRDRRRGDDSRPACRSDRHSEARTCGRRHGARLRPLAADSQIGQSVDGEGAVGVFPRGRSAKDQLEALPEARLYNRSASERGRRKAAILRIRTS